VPQEGSLYDSNQIRTDWLWTPRGEGWITVAYGITTKDPLNQPEPTNQSYYELLSASARQKYDTALESCAAQSESNSHLADPYPQALALQIDLQGTIERVVNTVDFARTVYEPYRECMAAYGYSIQRLGDLNDLVEGLADDAGYFRTDAASSHYPNVLSKARARERSVAEHDVACRSTVAIEAAELLYPAYNDWAASSGITLKEILDGWADLAIAAADARLV
jgi:hypothetical protein